MHFINASIHSLLSVSSTDHLRTHHHDTQVVSPGASTYLYDCCLRPDDVEFKVRVCCVCV